MPPTPGPARRPTGSRDGAGPAVAELEIRRVGYGQADALRLIEEVQQEYVARYGGRDDTPLEHAMFDPPTGSFFVGYLAGEPVASGAWRRHRVPAHGVTNSAEVKRMYVAPAARGLGLARRMLAHLEATAAAAGAEAMVLETGIKQPEAIALYVSAGYSPIPGFGFHKEAPESRCFGKLLPAPGSAPPG